jgi:hypothetical protein
MIGSLDYSYANRFVKMLDGNAHGFTLQTFDDDRVRKDSALTRVLPRSGVTDFELLQLHARRRDLHHRQ